MGSSLTTTDRSNESEQVCASCTDEFLEYGEEVFLLQIAQVQIQNNIPYLPVVLDDTGNFLYEPHWFEFACWESIAGDLNEWIRDVPPLEDRNAALSCHYCKSGICNQEYVGALRLGELHASKRVPAGAWRGEQFVDSGPPYIICLYCLYLINENELTMWEDGISQVGECPECLQMRCWRYGACGCLCHGGEQE